MNWIRPNTRLAIYLRDGMACAWCGQSVEDGIMLTLDHCKPRSKGGTNDVDNLVTSCNHCNSSRGNRSMMKFATVVSAYVDAEMPQGIVRHINNCRRRDIAQFKVEAKAMMSRRNDFGTKIMSAINAH